MPISMKKRLERRRSMLDSARELMGSVTYDRITMRDIADAAGVTPPTLYNTFMTREALLIEAIAEEIMECVEAALDADDRGLDRIFLFLSLMADLMASRGTYPQALLDVISAELPPAAIQIGMQAYEGTCRVFITGIEEMRADGEVADWVETGPLADRMGTLHRGLRTDLVSGLVPQQQVDDATTYALAVMLTGVTRGRARERCQAIATESQRRVGAPSPA